MASFTSWSGNIISIPQVINTDEELENLTTLLADFMTSSYDNLHNGFIAEIIAMLISAYEETLPEIIEFSKRITSKK